jgi:predicted RNA binding protein YcfA (HicA-like mRNA interferase family)
MPRRKQFSGDSLCALLSAHGFVPVRQKGSHRIMQKVEKRRGRRFYFLPPKAEFGPQRLGPAARTKGNRKAAVRWASGPYQRKSFVKSKSFWELV